MRKCRNCLCLTCINVCCNKRDCPGKKWSCGRYRKTEQMEMFAQPRKETYRPAPRASWEEYGLGDKKRREELTGMMRSPEYAEIARNCAHIATPEFCRYILLSAKENLSYEGLERLWGMGKIERMACGKSDFYGYRRFFYYLFDEEVKKVTNHEKLAKVTGVDEPVEVEAAKMILERVYEDIEKGLLEKDPECYVRIYKVQLKWLRSEAE